MTTHTAPAAQTARLAVKPVDDTVRVCGQAHAGDHLVMWNYCGDVGGTVTGVEVIETALIHASDDDGVLAVRDMLATAAETGPTPLNDEQWAIVRDVITDACEYMHTNSYADHAEFPEDAVAAALLGPTGAKARACFAHSIALNRA